MIALFPGQGSQTIGMGKSFYENFATARDVFNEASEALSINLKKLCFEGPESELTLTENCQPALLTCSIALFKTAQKEKDFNPSLVAGHSLGEYSALVANNTLTLSTAVRLVRARGCAMQKAVPEGEGGMCALLGLTDEAIQNLCELSLKTLKEKNFPHAHSLVLEPANFNAPGQVVIAGHLSALEEAKNQVSLGVFPGAKIIPLNVSAPFHTSLMSPARESMQKVFESLLEMEKPKNMSCPYIPNQTARPHSEPPIVLELLLKQMDHCVLWRHSMEKAMDLGIEKGFEFGPGKVLSGLAKRISKNYGKKLEIQSINEVTNLDFMI